MNKAAASAVQFANCILLHAYSRTTASSQLRENKQKLNTLFYKLAHQYFWWKIKNRL